MKRYDRHQNSLNNSLLQLCVLSCYLVHPKTSSIFHTEQSCDRLKFHMSAAQKKEQKKKNVEKNKTKNKKTNKKPPKNKTKITTTTTTKMHLGHVF